MGGQPSAPKEGPRTLVVVGAGPGGAKLVSIILSKGWAGKIFNVVLIDRSDAYHHNIAATRTVAQPGWAVQQFWPYDTFNKLAAKKVKGGDAGSAFKFVQGNVTSITNDAVTVTPADGGAATSITFDACVVATGSTVAFPAKTTLVSHKEAIAQMDALQQRIAAAKSVVVVGGGATGVELAGELAWAYGSGPKTSKRDNKAQVAKKLTLVHSGPTLVSSVPGLKPKIYNRLYNKLTAMGVSVRLNTRANLPARPPSAKEEGKGAEESKAGDESKTAGDLPRSVIVGDGAPVQVGLADGSTVEADVVLLCGGARVNSQAYATSLADVVDSDGRLKVDGQHRVVGHEGRLWAIGDCCNSAEGKLAYSAMDQAKWLAGVLAKLASNPAAKVKDRKLVPSAALLALIGPHDGVAQLPNGMILGSTIVSKLKGKDMLLGMYKADYFGKALAKTLP